MKNRKNKLIAAVIVLFAVGFCSINTLSKPVSAGGEGSDGSGVCTSNCGDPQWWGVYPSDSHPGKGGISWKFFKTRSSYYSLYKLYKIDYYSQGPIYCKDKSKQESAGCSGSGIIGGLRGGGYDKKLATNCSSSKYKWYIVLAFDGWHDEDMSSTRYFGPASVDGTYTTVNGNESHFYKTSAIQTTGQIGLSATLAALANGTLSNGQRVDGATVKHFCALDNTGACAGYTGGDWPDGLGYVCAPTDVTLTAYARKIPQNAYGDYEYLNGGNAISSKKVQMGNSATVTSANYNPKGYTWAHWGTSSVCSHAGSNRPCTVNPLNSDSSAGAYYEFNTYEGKSRAAGATGGWSSIADSKKVETEWLSSGTNNKVVYTIKNCDPIGGCSGSIRHLLRRRYGTGSTKYKITRTSNYSSVSGGTVVGETTETFDGDNVNETSTGRKYLTVKVSNFNGNLYPGMVVCEKLEFMPHNDIDTPSTVNYNVGDAATTACITVEGNAQPDDPPDSETKNPSDDSSYYNIKVKNDSVTRYNTYQRSVYAKPGDKLNYWATYNPVLQYTYTLIPETISINSGTTYPTSGRNSSSTLGTMFNNHKPSSLGTWKNSVTVYSSRFASNISEDYTYANGDTVKKNEDNDHTVLPSEAGRSLDESIVTNRNSTTKTTARQVTFKMNNNYDRAEVYTTNPAKTASALIPYNFDTSLKVDTPDDTPIYAGEERPIDFTLTIKPRNNPVTMNDDDPDYATKIDEAKYKIIVYRGDYKPGGDWGSDDLCARYGLTNNQTDCGYSKEANTSFTNVNQFEDTKRNLSRTFYAQDIAAGSQICVAAAFFPANSGAPTNMDKKGSNTWRVSDAVCYRIAKKPSLQVWGGNIYTQNNISALESDKNSLAGYADAQYAIQGNSGLHRIFGSWGELGIIASGNVIGFSSGASMGYVTNTNGVLSPSPVANVGAISPGGSTITALCLRSVLTFANACTGSTAGGIGNATSSDNAQRDKQAVIDRFAGSKDTDYSGNVDLGLVGSYAHGYDNISVGCAADCTVNDGVRMVHSDKTVTINSNIIYGGAYNRLSVMPKVVIYGKNVEIACGVTRIDAVIIADDTVVTCNNLASGSGSYYDRAGKKINEGPNSTQLKVNGAILASRLVPNRTYGSATGSNSIVPAEIINFDPSLYLWGGGANNEDEEENVDTSAFQVTYIHEISPRK